MSTTDWTEKAKQARTDAAAKRRQAAFHRDIASRGDRDFRAGHVEAAAQLDRDADVDLAFALWCEQQKEAA